MKFIRVLAILLAFLLVFFLTACDFNLGFSFGEPEVPTADIDVPTGAPMYAPTEEPTEETYIIYPPEDIPMRKGIDLRSPREDILKIREAVSSPTEEKLEEVFYSYCFADIGSRRTVEELSTFLSVIDSVPYPDVVEGEFTWIKYEENITKNQNKYLNVTKEAANGDFVRILYYLEIDGAEDPLEWITETVIVGNKDSLLPNPIVSKNGRITFVSELRKKHPIYEGDSITWRGVIDGIAFEVFYYADSIAGVNTEEFLDSFMIIPLAELGTVAPEKIEQVSAGMTYEEVTGVLSVLGRDIGSGAVIYEYHLSDGRVAHVHFQKDDAEALRVEFIRVE